MAVAHKKMIIFVSRKRRIQLNLDMWKKLNKYSNFTCHSNGHSYLNINFTTTERRQCFFIFKIKIKYACE